MKLTEANISRIVKHLNDDELCFITAFRKENSRDKNTELNKQLANDLRFLGYGFINITGGFIEDRGEPTEKKVTEQLYLVINNNDPKKYTINFAKEMIYLCNKYNQDDILLKTKDYPAAWYDKKGNRESEIFTKISLKNIQDGFSKIHGTKFSLIETNYEFEEYSRLKQTFGTTCQGIKLRRLYIDKL